MKKESYRSELKKIRAALSQERREQASYSLFIELLTPLAYFHRVLSFASFGQEIDTSLLNLFLARTDRLLLPKIVERSLKIFQVTNPEKQLLPNSFGLYEPNPALCSEVDHDCIEVVLVPALAFDQCNHRLGYGGGYYDRFLKEIPHAHTIGVGFKEQLIPALPIESTDISLEKVSLF